MTKEQAQAFLDELTALSRKHGIVIGRYADYCDWPCLLEIETTRGAYDAAADEEYMGRFLEWNPKADEQGMV